MAAQSVVVGTVQFVRLAFSWVGKCEHDTGNKYSWFLLGVYEIYYESGNMVCTWSIWFVVKD